MARNLFSIPIFLIVFRETLEAAIIVSVLLGLAKQIVFDDRSAVSTLTGADTTAERDKNEETGSAPQFTVDGPLQRRKLHRKLRIQILVGAGSGLFLAIAIGAAFVAVWFTKAADLWSKTEDLWEGVFELVASLMIFVMGITMLKMDRAKAKWRIKLENAFEGRNVDRGTKTGKWGFFILPCITVLREGLEAVVFVGGVSLGEPATSIPIATLAGLLCGFVCGFLIYQFASRSTLTIFLIVMTNLLLLIGAGLFSRSVGAFQEHAFDAILRTSGADDEVGTGPGSYDVRGNVWHLDCCSNGEKVASGWTIFTAVLGWSNNASLGTILSYVFYWLAAIAVLVFLKFKEGRTKFFGYESATARRRRGEDNVSAANTDQKSLPAPESQ